MSSRGRAFATAGVARELAVRAGADAQVIPEAPVVEVVAALASALRKGRDLVLFEAARGEHGMASTLHVPREIIIRQRRRLRGEQRAGFKGELVVREMRRLQ